jgi:hypothetical protein
MSMTPVILRGSQSALRPVIFVSKRDKEIIEYYWELCKLSFKDAKQLNKNTKIKKNLK